jgi:hypothetical protein
LGFFRVTVTARLAPGFGPGDVRVAFGFEIQSELDFDLFDVDFPDLILPEFFDGIAGVANQRSDLFQPFLDFVHRTSGARFVPARCVLALDFDQNSVDGFDQSGHACAFRWLWNEWGDAVKRC